MKDFKVYDVFKSFLVEDAEYDGYIELPKIRTSDLIPEKVVTFSKAMKKSFKDFDCWVMFYEHDKEFERLWHNPRQYLTKLKKFKGVISPDFSLYRNMPLCMQIWNTYRGRALAYWLQKNGIEIIPNVRFNDARTYSFCFDGIEPFKTVALGTHGCIKKKADELYFKKGLKELVIVLHPKTIIVYGAVPDDVFADTARIARTANKAVDAGKALSRTQDVAKAIKTVSPSTLTKTHKLTQSRKQFSNLVESIRKYGIKEPIKYVEFKGTKYVVDGHHRLQAAKQLKLKNIPVEKVSLPYKGYKTIEDLLWFD